MAQHGQLKKQKEQVRIEALRDPRWDAAPRWLVGIDDTDNLESRGTGFRARELAKLLQEAGLARLVGITRHQLFVSPEIPYTSHNSSACLALDVFAADREPLIAFCRDYLARESAPGSDAGLCVGLAEAVDSDAIAFAQAAKVRVLTQPEAHARAAACGFHLEGLTGTHQGVIGALSAVALHATRNDGRYLWMRGVRNLPPGAYVLSALRAETDIEVFLTTGGEEVAGDSSEITITDWARPVLTGGRAVLFLEEDDHDIPDLRRWRVANKEFIKRF